VAGAPDALGRGVPSDVLLGNADVTGDFTALMDDTDAISPAFEEEFEVELLFMLTACIAANVAFWLGGVYILSRIYTFIGVRRADEYRD
jgi:hypothetical protein